jgi:hypothetical protein
MGRGEGTQRELAERWGVDCSTVTRSAEIAKHGAPSALKAMAALSATRCALARSAEREPSSGSRGTLLCPGPLRTGLAAFTAHPAQASL